jgi:hypothetical protein
VVDLEEELGDGEVGDGELLGQAPAVVVAVGRTGMELGMAATPTENSPADRTSATSSTA